MRKVIITQDKKGIESDVYPYNRKAWLLNLFIQRMEQAGYPLKTVEDIQAVLSTGVEKYVRTQIVEGSRLELAGGLRLNKAAVMDVVEIPDISEAQSVERMLKQYHNIQINKLAFVDGVFAVTDEIKEWAIEKNTRYAASQKQVEIFNDAKELCKAVNRFNAKHGPKSRSESWHPLRDVMTILEVNVETAEYEVDTMFILNTLNE
jgi:hypothetical protein